MQQAQYFQSQPFQQAKKNTTATDTTRTFSGDCLIGDLKRVIEKKKPKKNLVTEEVIIFHLPKIPTILNNKDFEKKQEIKKQENDKIKKEIDLTRLKGELHAGQVPKKVELYFGGKNYSVFLMSSNLNLNKSNKNFVDFLSSDIGCQILRENIRFIHIETGNILYENYNTNQSIYDFLLRQQDETKKDNSCYLSL